MPIDTAKLTKLIHNKALELGFGEVGIAEAMPLDHEAKQLERWLMQGYHGDMSYMERNFDLRIDPTQLLPGTKSIICLSHNYYNDQKFDDPNRPKIAKYAYGRDYHKVLKKKCKKLIQYIKELVGTVQARAYVDSAPILERVWAKRAGLGWIGKNSLLLTKKKGSYYLLAEILLDIPLLYNQSIAKDYCGSCTKCIDACPTQAIVAPYQIDANRCISYLTIEYKKQLPQEFKNKMQNWAFGCDICQDVCPINARSENHNEPELMPSQAFVSLNIQQMQDMTEAAYNQIFEGTAIKRTKYEGWIRNLKFLK